MATKPTPETQQAIAALRELIDLAVSDIEGKAGGPIGVQAQHSLRFWLARAFETGRDLGKAVDKAQVYLKLKKEFYACEDVDQRAGLLKELDTLWGQLSVKERRSVLLRRG